MGNSETAFSLRPFGIAARPGPTVDQPDGPHEEVDEGTRREFDSVSTVSSRISLGEDSLLEGIRQGDRDSLAVLFRRYARMVRTVAHRILRDASEADDLVQDVFLFVFRKACLFDPAMGSVRSWLIQVTWHRAIDRRRYLAARHFYTTVELEEDLLEWEAGQGLSRFYEESMEGSLGRETLRRIDESLSEDQRRVIRLYFFEGHTVGEIATMLGQTPGNVRNHYYRALEKMRREIFPPHLRKR